VRAVLFNGNLQKLNINLSFNNTSLSLSDNHKHLGVTFIGNYKWSNHRDNIEKLVSKHISVLRKLKFILYRETLSKLYIVLEYGCEVWDGCSMCDSEKLEKLQLEAARLVTRLPSFDRRESLCFETWWELLQDHRKNRKLTLFYRMHCESVPDYLIEKLPNRVNQTNDYNLRN